jgi:hypothetical protein
MNEAMKTHALALPIIALFALAQPAYSVDGLSITRDKTNIVLSWPSTQFENYTVQYKTTVDSNTTWLTLTNCIQAVGTATFFTNFGVLPPQSTNSNTNGGGTGQIPPMPMAATQATESDSEAAVSPPMPPLPWDPSTWPEPAQQNSYSLLSAEAMTTTTTGDYDNCGFYRVVQIPSFQSDPSQYVFDGPTFLPIDFGGYFDMVQNLEVLLNGVPTTFSRFMPYDYNGQTYWGVGIYFDRIPSGTYQLQLRCTLSADDTVGDNSEFLVLSNKSTSVTVNNTITFQDWDDLITSTNYTFKAKSRSQNVDWYIDIYDAYGDYIKGGTGHTTDGNIAWTWDLKDINGNLRTDLDYDPYLDTYLTIETKSQGLVTSTKTVYTPPVIVDFPKVGGWVFAYQDRYYLESVEASSFQQTYIESMQSIAGAPTIRNYPTQLIPLAFGTNYVQTNRNSSYSYLKGILYNAQNRNFFYFGHGGFNGIGCDYHQISNNITVGGILTKGSKACITSQWVKENVTFNRYGGSRPYRFVFLDGCNTANGDWPSAFGIEQTEHPTIGWYSSTNNTKHVRPSAFVGWSSVVGASDGWGSAESAWRFYTYFFSNWSVNYNSTLTEAINLSMSVASWPPADKRQYLKKFGYTGMKFTDFNTK